ncbi:MAG TPA: transposase [Cellvibrionaceae bacterium]
MRYRRVFVAGGYYFFTVKLANPKNRLLVEHVDVLRAAFKCVKNTHPFFIDAIVVMPNHLHCILHLPDGDCNYPMRWRLIKSYFSRALAPIEPVSASRKNKKERGIWQRRFWEHTLRDEGDYVNHINYIHNNPVKHGYVSSPKDWPYSSLHCYERIGVHFAQPCSIGANPD